jgi:hypothetical protein
MVGKTLFDSSRKCEVHEPCSIVLHRSATEDALLRRVRSEFREMPSLRLTLDQAMRLWNLDRPTCGAVLESLVASHFLHQNCDGRYARTHARY